jgi:hypothetical protein
MSLAIAFGVLIGAAAGLVLVVSVSALAMVAERLLARVLDRP